MPLSILDPYGSRKYCLSKGRKQDDYFKVEFKEGKFYLTNEGYVLMANVTKYKGAVRAFKPEVPLEPGICAIPIYKTTYEIWEKKNKESKAIPVNCEPSVFEKNLVNHLSTIVDESKSYQGAIAFLPDDQILDLSTEELVSNIERNCQLVEVDSTGTLPEYVAPSGNGYKKNGYSKVTPEDKTRWLKKELCSSIKDGGYNEEMSLVDLVEQLVKEVDSEDTLAIYTNLLQSILSA